MAYCIGCVVAPTKGLALVALAAGLIELAALTVTAVTESKTVVKSKKAAYFLPRRLQSCVRARVLLQDDDLFMARPGKSCNDEQLRANYRA